MFFMQCAGSKRARHSIGQFRLVVMSITTMTFAARDFSARRGASDEHTLRGSVRSEQRSLAEKNCRPEGCAEFGLWRRCSSVTDPLRDMLPPRALPQAKFGATYVIVVMFMTTKRKD